MARCDLAQYARENLRGKPDLSTAACRAMVFAVQWLHTHTDYVHMDIKPQQFFGFASGFGVEWKLGDFDCCRKQGTLAAPVSSPPYRPPERAVADGDELKAEQSYDLWCGAAKLALGSHQRGLVRALTHGGSCVLGTGASPCPSPPSVVWENVSQTHPPRPRRCVRVSADDNAFLNMQR